jgi:plasmid stability protein
VADITVSIPDDVYRAARICAAKRGSSVSAIVAEYLCSLSEHEPDFTRFEAQQRRIQQELDHFSVRDGLGREELHERTVG